MPNPQTKETEQGLQNMSFDETFQVTQVELLGYDKDAGVLRRIKVDATGQLKITT